MTEKYISAELLTEKNGLYLLCIKGGLVQKWWIFHFRAKKQMRRTDEKRPSFLRTYAYVQKCVSESFGWWGAYCVRFPALTMERKLLLLVIFLHLFQLYLHSADFHSGVFLLFFFYKIVNTAQNFIECWSIQASHASASQLCLIFGYEVIYVKLRT